MDGLFLFTNAILSTKCISFLLKIGEDYNIDEGPKDLN
jgi:hypothetical protein